MRRIALVALVCLSLVGVAAGSSLAANGNGPAPKATGDIWFMNTGYPTPLPAHWVFNAQEGSPAKGNMTYEDPNGSYTAKVTDVHVHGQYADITAEVTSSTYPFATVGQSFSWTVYDGAEPGVGADSFTYWFTAGQYSGNHLDLPPITAGNLQVHS
jgi:hypothetical protein